MSADSHLVLVATGSSACIVLPSYLQEIKARTGHDITVVMTASALRFVSAEVVGWFAGRVITPDAAGVNPVEVALHARAVIVLPASGNTIATAALGLMPTTAATVIGVCPRPVLFFPQMHEAVWRKPLTTAHLHALTTAGHVVVDPRLALGYEISRGESAEGWSMPGPEEAAELIHTAHVTHRTGHSRMSDLSATRPLTPAPGIPAADLGTTAVGARRWCGLGSRLVRAAARHRVDQRALPGALGSTAGCSPTACRGAHCSSAPTLVRFTTQGHPRQRERHRRPMLGDHRRAQEDPGRARPARAAPILRLHHQLTSTGRHTPRGQAV